MSDLVRNPEDRFSCPMADISSGINILAFSGLAEVEKAINLIELSPDWPKLMEKSINEYEY